MRTDQATGADFKNPRTTQWNVGVTRQLFARSVSEVSYVGSRGDNLIRPTDINYPDPAAVVALIKRWRRRQSGAAVSVLRRDHYRETTARARYNGLLTSTKIDAGANGT